MRTICKSYKIDTRIILTVLVANLNPMGVTTDKVHHLRLDSFLT